MKKNQITYSRLLAGLAGLVFGGTSLQAQTMLPSTYVYPSSSADKTKPGFTFNISEVAASEPNAISWAEAQLAGLEGDNLADPTVVGIASGPAQPPSPSTAPITFIIPGTINLSKVDQSTFGHFTPDDQMPGLPGTTGSTDNAAFEALTYLDLPAGTIAMGVNSDDGFKVTIGGANPKDPFAVNVGQFNGGRGSADTTFQFVAPQAGIYAARLLWENGGGDANVEWWTIKDGINGTNRVLVNDVANGGIPAYRAITANRAYVSAVDPLPGADSVVPNEGIHIKLVDGATAVAQSSIVLTLDNATVSPTLSKSGNVTSIDFSPAAVWAPNSQHSASLVFTDGTQNVTNTWNFTVQYYLALDPSWRVTNVDTNKAGFNWNIFANGDTSNTGNSNERAERDLSLLAVDANGAVLANLAAPSAVGSATGAGVAVTGAPNAPVHFEIATTLNVDIGPGTMPGAPSTDGTTDGQAAEVITYLSLPAGVVSMEISSDDGWRLYSGSNPTDLFGRSVVAEHNDGTGPIDFSFNVTQAGIYPFRLVWENGTGGSALSWSSVTPAGKRVLVNDLANGGIPAYRALVAGTTVAPYVVGTEPLAALHQQDALDSSLTIIIADGTTTAADSSVTLTVDGKTVTPVTSRQGKYLTVSDGGKAFSGLQLPADVHTAVLTYKDSAGTSRTQQWNFNNIQILQGIPASPIVSENFDSYPEATSVANTVPPGWTAWNYTAENTPGWDLTDKSSDAYKNWIIISTDTLSGIEGSAQSNDPSQTINGQPVANFASGKVLWATSDGRSGVQAQFCISKPFDLSGITNPVLIYSSLMRMSGNANAQADGIEYSVDGGNTWQPGIIYVTTAYGNEGYVKLTPDGSIDVLRTLNAPFSVLDWVNPTNNMPGGGTFGSGLAEPVTQALAPLLAPRNENTTPSTRVDGIRLPGASKQKSVMLRFYQLGNCSWWWGVDNLAFYDIAPSVTPPPANAAFSNVSVSADRKNLVLTYTGTLQSADVVNGPYNPVSGANSPATVPIASTGNKFYRVQ
jgi:hypothetical protein